MNGKIKRKVEKDGSVRLHEAVSDSVYMRGDGLESQTLTDFAKPHRLSFLHISDPHSQTWGMQVLRNILAGANTTYANANDVMGLVTGDLTRGGNINNYGSHTTNDNYPVEIIAKWNRGLSSVTYNNKPMLLVKGNHDTVDTNVSLNEAAANSAFVFEANQDASGDIVNFAMDGSTKMGYWYKDFAHNGVTMRVIGLDEYQHSLIGSGESYPTDSTKYAKVYSEEQLEWLVDLLKATPKQYYIVIVHHQPQYATHPADVVNDFTHHGREGQQGTRYLNGMSAELEGNIDTIAQIVDAYLHKKTTEVTCLNAALASGNENREITIEPDFRDATPAYFACHVCGHTHRDFHEYHPEYPEQLCLNIAANLIEASGGEEMFQDVVRAGSGVNSYLMNRVTIDADRNVVVVERIGAGTLRDDVLIQDGSARKAIEFAIPKIMEQPNSGSGGESITIDPAPTSGSVNAVSSGGVFTALSGKAEEFIVNVSYNGSAYSADKTPEECCAAFNGGKRVIFQSMTPLPNDGGSQTYVATSVTASSSTGSYSVYAVGSANDNSVSVLKYQKSTITGTMLSMTNYDLRVVNNLTSTSTTSSLSAAQGKALNDAKQDTLVSGTSIKTINSTSLLGSGNIAVATASDLPSTITQAQINAGTATSGVLITPKLLVDNFQKHTAIETMPSGAIAPTDGYEPNKMYDFGKVSSVTFATYDTSKEMANAVNLYMCTFVVASGGTTLNLNANIKYPNGDDGTELTNLLTEEDRVFEITIRRIVVTENNEDVSYYLMSYLYFD